ncbi:MAG: hypothetical protein V3U72_03830 [Candidatus Aenigmarchaeota archaeon]
MAGKVDIREYLRKIENGLNELYSNKFDLSKYKYRDETPKAYESLINGLKKNNLQFISKGLNDLYKYTNPDIKENEIKKNYGKEKVILKLFYGISGTVKNMADEISKAVAGSDARATA